MAKPDLDEISRRVFAARDEFLAALEAHDRHEGRTILDGFVKQFSSNDRCEVTRQTAAEAETLINGFGGQVSGITSQVAVTLLTMQSTISALAVHILKESIGAIARPPVVPDDASITQQAFIRAETISAAADVTVQAGDEATVRAFRVGELVEELEDLSRDAIRSRTRTLSVFKEEHFGISPANLFEAARRGRYRATGSAALDLAMDRARALAVELGRIMIEENELYRYGDILVRLKKALETKRPDTSPGGTELLNRLVSQMRAENRLIASVDEAYRAAIDEMDRIVAACAA